MAFPFSYIFVPTVSNYLFFSHWLRFLCAYHHWPPPSPREVQAPSERYSFWAPVLLGSHLGGRVMACLLCCRGLGFVFCLHFGDALALFSASWIFCLLSSCLWIYLLETSCESLHGRYIFWDCVWWKVFISPPHFRLQIIFPQNVMGISPLSYSFQHYL